MEVILAKSAGFCFGVARAVRMAEELAASGRRVSMLGHIIHNDHENARLAGLGLALISSPEEAEEGGCVLLRAHGEGRLVHEALAARRVEVADATCPKVARVQEIVREAEEAGRQPVMIGDPAHPEVRGVGGWCGNLQVFSGPEEALSWVKSLENATNMPITVVSQTTLRREIWESSLKILKKQCTNLKIFDTICKATEYRQKEAAILAERCQAMVVVGDTNSSNTGRLAMICREHCENVVLIDQASELDLAAFQGVHHVGITAGASTPAWIIKEVNKTMSELKTVETAQEENFADMLEQSIKTLNTGDKVTGIVTSIGTTEVQIDLGTKHAGYIPYDEVSNDPSLKPEDVVKVGDEIEVFVVRVNDQEGTCQLSKKKLDGLKVWDDIMVACENKTVVEGTVTEENKGGVVANVKGVRVFIPASQSGIAKGGDMASLVGKPAKMKITEVNRARRRVIGSIRAVTAEARKAAFEKIWSEIEVGKKYQGVVKSLTSYGAFVDIGGVDGMVHVSELSWNRIKNPAEVVKVGDEIEVFVLSFDTEKHKISLGYKTAEMNPWTQFTSKYAVGDVAKAKIVKLMTFGAFAEILPGVDGLIHISQIADRRIDKPEDVLSEGQMVDAKITAVDEERKKISLSIRALLDEAQRTDAGEEDAVVASSDGETTEVAPDFAEEATEE